MKPLPPPDVPGETEAERFSNAVKMILSVPHEAIAKEKTRIKRGQSKRKQARERAANRTTSR
jgi:hypothetical protein